MHLTAAVNRKKTKDESKRFEFLDKEESDWTPVVVTTIPTVKFFKNRKKEVFALSANATVL